MSHEHFALRGAPEEALTLLVAFGGASLVLMLLLVVFLRWRARRNAAGTPKRRKADHGRKVKRRTKRSQSAG